MPGGKKYFNERGVLLLGNLIGSLRSRLQFLLVSAVVLAMVLAGLMLAQLIRHDRLSESEKRFDDIFSHVFGSLKEREQLAGVVVQDRAGQQSLMTAVNMVYQYATPSDYDPLIFDVEKQRIANQLSNRVGSSDHFEQLMVYDGKGVLMAFDVKLKGEISNGYVSYEAGQPVVMLRAERETGTVWERGELPKRLQMQAVVRNASGWQGYARSHERLTIEAAAPIVRPFPGGESQTVGWVIGQDFFVSDLVQDLVDRSGAQFAVLLDDGTRIGKLEDVDFGFIESQFGETPMPPTGFVMVEHPAHFLAVQALVTPGQGRVYLVAGMDRRVVQEDILGVLLALLGVLLLTVVLLVPLGAWAARRLVVNPVSGLVKAVTAVRHGQQGQRVPLTGPNELVHLAASFNDMLAALEDRERMLQRERDFASGLLSSSPMLVVLLDLQGRVRYANPFFENLSGYRLDELVGQDWYERFVPERERATRRDIFKRSTYEGLKRQYVNTVLMRDGGQRLIEWNTLPMQTPEGPGFLAVGMDVTEREEVRAALMSKEQELQRFNAELEQRVQDRTNELQLQVIYNDLILRSTDDGFLASDPSGNIRNVNPALCRMLGYSREELLQMHVSEIEGIESAEEVVEHIRNVMATGHDRFDTVQRRKDGSLVEVEVTASKVDLHDGVMLYAFERDITERKAAHAALQRARDEAERANTAKSDFLSRMSHELRTPLNAILGFGELMETDTEQPLRENQADNLSEIMTAGQHLLGLVNEVLDLSRIESGHLRVTLERVALRPLIDACIKQIQPSAAQRGLTIEVLTPEDAVLWADSLRLRQVLLNLLSNAVKYNSEGGRLGVRAEPASEGRLRIAISDTGKGIPEEFLPRLFRPFERLETAYEGVEGTGIGLALVKKLVEAMDGSVGVDSVPDAGSTFWIDLPLAEAVPDRQSKLLYIEDNPANLRLVQKIMAKRSDIRLLDAINGEQGLLMAVDEQPDMILMDINLPGMSGIEVLQELRKRPETAAVPVVALSANAMPRDIEKGKEVGFAAYLTKPIDVNRLLQTIDDFLGTVPTVSENLDQKS